MPVSDSDIVYTTLGKEASAEIKEKKSVFIGYAKPVKSEEEAISFIKEIRHKHADARHNVYAYSLNGGMSARYSDDGEPQGTAGLPVLDVIKKSGIDDACIVVTRYFGGILLGTGGLVRAYSAAAKEAVEAAGIVTFERYTEFSINCSYPDYQKISAELPKLNAIVDGVDYADSITLRFAIKTELGEKLSKKIQELSAGRCVPRELGTRLDHA